MYFLFIIIFIAIITISIGLFAGPRISTPLIKNGTIKNCFYLK
jgi:hypothetical protein